MKNILLLLLPLFCFISGYILLAVCNREQAFATPTLLGVSATNALREATRRGFTLKIIAEKETTEIAADTVIAQKPVPGSLIKPRQTVFVTLAQAPRQDHRTRAYRPGWPRLARTRSSAAGSNISHYTPRPT